MFSKIKNLFISSSLKISEIQKQSNEILWSNIYHDSIRGKKYIEELSIYPGRWAANYSLLYVINRILSDYKPKKIIEFGLGESSKLISTYLQNELIDSAHTIIEHNPEWVEVFRNRFKLNNRVKIDMRELEEKSINGNISITYKNITDYSNEPADLFIVDGISSDRYSRNYIFQIFAAIKSFENFIIIIDDYERQGEKDTGNDLICLLESRGIELFIGYYYGNKTQIVIATSKYQFVTSL
jgi:hypothetical protein